MILLGDSDLIFHSLLKVSFTSFANSAVAYDIDVFVKLLFVNGDGCWSMSIQFVVRLVCMSADIGGVDFSSAAWLAVERSGRCILRQ